MRNKYDIYMKNGYVFKDVINVTENGIAGETDYVKFYQVVDETEIPTVINKKLVIKMVEKDV